MANVEGMSLVITGHKVEEVLQLNLDEVEARTPKETAGNHGAANHRRCSTCNSPNHLANKCRAFKTESIGRSSRSPMQPATRKVIAQGSTTKGDAKDILDILLSDSKDDTVRQTKIADQESKLQSIRVEIHGVPVHSMHY